MAAVNYDECLRRLLIHEGGYTNHPADPGGPTNFGITIYDYRKYVKPGATASDVRDMSVNEAKSIYRAKYWDAQRCDDLPSGVDYAVFDYGVNSGIGRSAKVLQRVLGARVDGAIGDATIELASQKDAKETVNAICDERMAFLRRLRTFPVFGTGWTRRVREVRARGVEMAASAVPPPSADVAGSGKALGDDVPVETGSTAKPMTKSKIGVTQIATGTGGAGLALEQLNEHAAQAARLKDQAHSLGLTDILVSAMHSPIFWIGLAVAAAAGLTFYWRWKDHGRGALI